MQVKNMLRKYALNDGGQLHHYYAQDSHGSVAENFSHISGKGKFIALYIHKLPIVMNLFAQVKGLIK